MRRARQTFDQWGSRRHHQRVEPTAGAWLCVRSLLRSGCLRRQHLFEKLGEDHPECGIELLLNRSQIGIRFLRTGARKRILSPVSDKDS